METRTTNSNQTQSYPNRPIFNLVVIIKATEIAFTRAFKNEQQNAKID